MLPRFYSYFNALPVNVNNNGKNVKAMVLSAVDVASILHSNLAIERTWLALFSIKCNSMLRSSEMTFCCSPFCFFPLDVYPWCPVRPISCECLSFGHFQANINCLFYLIRLHQILKFQGNLV